MPLAKTAAAGEGLLPEVLEYTSSLSFDRALYRVDLLGSAAHAIMLGRTRIIPPQDARALRDGLLQLLADADAGSVQWEMEEDIHMAVERELGRRLGEVAGRLHTARSRNDQVATDVRLWARSRAREGMARAASLVEALCERAEREAGKQVPTYTHRQRAQPATVPFLLCAWAAMFERDCGAFLQAARSADALPLGSGASSGTSLAIDREATRELLGFARLTMNALDAVGDRDFLLDYAFACAKALAHAARVAQDCVDFSSQEFGLIRLDDRISFGSSMMPHKRNPDLFELVRAKSARGLGHLTALFALLLRLPTGYMRDLQDDKLIAFELAPLCEGALAALATGLAHIHFDAEAGERALAGDQTQATDLAEALVRRGVPFREAHQAIGRLVRSCLDDGIPLARADLERLRRFHPAFGEEDLAALDPVRAAASKESAGGTGTRAVATQIAALKQAAQAARAQAALVPDEATLAERIRSATVE